MSSPSVQESIDELLTLHGVGAFAEMERRARLHHQSYPHSPIVCELLGMAIAAQHRYAEALPFLERAAHDGPDDLVFWENLGQCQRQLKQFPAADRSLRHALALDPRSIEALSGLAAVLRASGRFDEAKVVAKAALEIEPGYVQRQHLERKNQLHSLIAAFPGNSDFHDELGLLLRNDGDVNGAETCLRRAIGLDPHNTRAHVNLALLLSAERRDPEALASVKIALDLLGDIGPSMPPEKVELFISAANVLDASGLSGDGVKIFKAVHHLNQDVTLTLPLIQAARNTCDWEFAKTLEQGVSRTALLELELGKSAPGELYNLSSVTAAEQLAAARGLSRQVLDRVQPRSRSVAQWSVRGSANNRLRVSYFSRDFFSHAVCILLVGVIEAHDRSRFEIVAHSFTPPGQDEYRKRIGAAFDRVIPVGQLPDEATVARIADDHVDIIVDINGWTTGNRATVLAARPAPVQVQWLGHPGSMGAPWIDYIIADPVLIPRDHEPHFSEKIVRLPHTYQPTDDKRQIGATQHRSDHGLPEDAFVFCSFNAAYKITQEIFDVWMQLLLSIDKSVLWLLRPSAAAQEAFLRAATVQGVAADRIIFAAKTPLAEHLARLRNADLALDCFPYGSHTTASDMLWAGVPMIGLLGETFASRVSASILTAGGLPDLIATTLEDYRLLALQLATDREEMSRLRTRVEALRLTSPLFDTRGFTRKLEEAYEAIWTRHRTGLPPDHIDIA